MPQYRLMVPGPIEVEPAIINHLNSPLKAHYGEAWAATYGKATASAAKLFGTRGHVVILVGSGNLANEIALHAILDGGETALVLDNGYFGHRLGEMVIAQGGHVKWLRQNWGQGISGSEVDDVLAADPSIKAVLAVHVETSTGIVNPISEIAAAANHHGVPLMVDGVASIGGEPFAMDAWGVDICTTASQKALGSPPGLALIAVNERTWELIESKKSPKGWITDIRIWKYWYDTSRTYHPHPCTMPVSNVEALQASFDQIFAEGLAARYQRHREMAHLFRTAIHNLGLRIAAQEGFQAATVSVVDLSSSRTNPTGLITFLQQHYQIQLSDGIEEWKGRVIRIGHMGTNASLPALIPLLYGIEHYLRKQGLAVTAGQSVQGLIE